MRHWKIFRAKKPDKIFRRHVEDKCMYHQKVSKVTTAEDKAMPENTVQIKYFYLKKSYLRINYTKKSGRDVRTYSLFRLGR